MIELTQGQSGYFSKPSQTLDPHLFDGEHLRPNVRETINNLLLGYLGTKYTDPSSWTMVWLAGSGISYQWSADRGNGDLDVLFTVDYDQLVATNPFFQWMERQEIADYIDADLRQYLWPLTAYTEFGYGTEEDFGWYLGQTYEITFFLNSNIPYTVDGITNIQPYAAYNVTADCWTTKPAKSPNTRYPLEFEQAANENLGAARTLLDRYNAVSREVGVNREHHKKLIVQQARNLFDTIHTGRRNAFNPSGEGYGDYYNYAWQRAKADGIINALNKIIGE